MDMRRIRTDTHGYAQYVDTHRMRRMRTDTHQIRTRHIHFATFTMLYPYLYIPPPLFFSLRAVAAPPSLETAPLAGSHLPVVDATFTTNHDFFHGFHAPAKCLMPGACSKYDSRPGLAVSSASRRHTRSFHWGRMQDSKEVMTPPGGGQTPPRGGSTSPLR